MYQILIEMYGIELHIMQLYREKRKAVEVFKGKHSESYSKLPRHAELLQARNPGTMVKI